MVPPGIEPESAALEAAVLTATPRGHHNRNEHQLNLFITVVFFVYDCEMINSQSFCIHFHENLVITFRVEIYGCLEA